MLDQVHIVDQLRSTHALILPDLDHRYRLHVRCLLFSYLSQIQNCAGAWAYRQSASKIHSKYQWRCNTCLLSLGTDTRLGTNQEWPGQCRCSCRGGTLRSGRSGSSRRGHPGTLLHYSWSRDSHVARNLSCPCNDSLDRPSRTTPGEAWWHCRSLDSRKWKSYLNQWMQLYANHYHSSNDYWSSCL